MAARFLTLRTPIPWNVFLPRSPLALSEGLPMARRCLALFSGMLDSILAVQLVQQQGVEVVGVRFDTPFTGASTWPAQAAGRLGISLERVAASVDYLRRLRQPRFGFGRAANACIDCRLSWLRQAGEWIERGRADFVITGEVLGQKAFGQRRRDLERLAALSGIEDLVVRPLSARRLAATRPEREGWLDRAQLGGLEWQQPCWTARAGQTDRLAGCSFLWQLLPAQ